jgi:DNA adenine methylase
MNLDDAASAGVARSRHRSYTIGAELSVLNTKTPSSSFGAAADALSAPARGKPFLRWAGSKRKQVSRLASFWNNDEHRRYVEPFAGSACLYFELEPKAAVLGDANRELIEVYRVVRDEPDRLYQRLCRIKRDVATYQRWRRKNPKSLDRMTRAVRFLYLNRNCFNGIYRTNARGRFNVPMGERPGAYFTQHELVRCANLLGSADLVAGDFVATLKRVEPGDFVYLDPPYAVTSRRIFRHYGKLLFDTTDMHRFADSLVGIVELKADFLVSYADCAEARAIAAQWNAVRLPVRRHVAGFSGHRRQAYEWLISNRSVDGVTKVS